MTTSILNDCLLIRNEPTEKLTEYFRKINVTIFDTILSRKQIEGNTIQEQEPKQTVLFILTAYSEDSPLVILRQDAKEEKDGICEYLNIPDYMRDRLINLTDPIVRTATTEYLEHFAGFEFRNLMFMKIQLNYLEYKITNRAFTIKKTQVATKEGESDIVTEVDDIKQHMAAVMETRRLAAAIEKVEKEIISRKKYLGISELKLWASKGDIKTGTRKANAEYSDKIR